MKSFPKENFFDLSHIDSEIEHYYVYFKVNWNKNVKVNTSNSHKKENIFSTNLREFSLKTFLFSFADKKRQKVSNAEL